MLFLGPSVRITFILQSDDCQCQCPFFLVEMRRESADHFCACKFYSQIRSGMLRWSDYLTWNNENSKNVYSIFLQNKAFCIDS